MYVHIGTHHPKNAHRDEVLAAMKVFARTAAAQPGILQVLTFAEQDDGRFATMTVWQARKGFEAAIPVLREAIADYPWDDWQAQKTDVMLADAVFAAGPLAISSDTGAG